MTGDAAPFDLWALPGRKSLLHDGRRLLLRTAAGRRVARLALSLALRHGAPYAFAVPAGPARRERAAWAADLADTLDGTTDAPRGRGAAVTRSAIVHMRALQALDAEGAGASERDLARLIFGSAEADATWNASPTRAKVRYLVRHGRAMRDGGYRQLLAAIE
ncbi:DNA -binding domain-containing protein [Roseomonas mucosa]